MPNSLDNYQCDRCNATTYIMTGTSSWTADSAAEKCSCGGTFKRIL